MWAPHQRRVGQAAQRSKTERKRVRWRKKQPQLHHLLLYDTTLSLASLASCFLVSITSEQLLIFFRINFEKTLISVGFQFLFYPVFAWNFLLCLLSSKASLPPSLFPLVGTDQPLTKAISLLLHLPHVNTGKGQRCLIHQLCAGGTSLLFLVAHSAVLSKTNRT